MQNKFKTALLMGAFILPAIASADDIGLPNSAATFHDLTRILDNNTLEKAKLEGARIKDEYLRLGTGGEIVDGPGTAAPNIPQVKADSNEEDVPDPTVDFIFGTGSSLRAKLRSPAGSTVTVAKGDTAFNKYRVISIDTRKVTLMDKDRNTFTASSTPSGY